MPGSPVVVLVVAAGAAWEQRAMQLLTDAAGVVVLKRCVDVDDLMAAAAAGQADVAVVGIDAPGFDAAAVDHLRAHGVEPVAVAATAVPGEAARLHASRIGVGALVTEATLDRLPGAAVSVVAAPPAGPPAAPDGTAPPGPDAEQAGEAGRVIAVWGPAGAPGRTTVAIGLAAELSRRRMRTVLVDADPQAPSVAQQLGVLDEVSGVLAAARLAGSGRLEERFASVQRGLDPWLTVVTGLPRADRWTEVRAGAVEHLLEVAAGQGHVVVDTGASLEDDAAGDLGARAGRHRLTLGALAVADELVVVGSADPVGLARLARGLVELAELADRAGSAPVRVVVNRMRPTLGWSEKEVAAMVAGFAPAAPLHFLPEDRAAADRALVAGRTLPEVGDSPLARALDALAAAVAGPGATAAPATGRRRRTRRR
ncbi:AAA family ATPase [Nocardioides pantholopis]|uniref:AAA family ATPase n=1 Tax=Nocardioides pantholopis TaxID=2483798 RepID=UPI000F094E18|nr:ParA family protein [Nocardioides pantholopis]